MDALAVKQACKFAKEHALKNGPIVSFFSIRFLTFYHLHILVQAILVYYFFAVLKGVNQPLLLERTLIFFVTYVRS